MSLYVVVLDLLTAIVVGLSAFAAAYFWLQFRTASRLKQAQQDADSMLEQARNQRQEIVLQGKDEALRLRSEVEQEFKERRAEVNRLERRLQQIREQTRAKYCRPRREVELQDATATEPPEDQGQDPWYEE